MKNLASDMFDWLVVLPVCIICYLILVIMFPFVLALCTIAGDNVMDVISSLRDIYVEYPVSLFKMVMLKQSDSF